MIGPDELALPDQVLYGPALEVVARELARREGAWASLVRHEPGQRIYHELLDRPHVSAWLICWMRDHDTGFHDHDISAGAVAVVAGRVREERLVLGGSPRGRTFGAGNSFHFSASDIHRVRHAGGGPAVTIHVYSPPLRRMGAYAVDADGTLVRHVQGAAEELRPLATV
ncbi:MAG TPA: cysteine dioxygenase family protein [Solirubrobacteraceae bacterium]|jgi:predicted metal-dependent enzyme (double-stranded beta helix superfamily)|nr:cysteine dioxygenase family protein [Solirubrobacteraceae bacterium]